MTLLSLILPTYNERGNIQTLVTSIEDIFKKNEIEGEIVVVDDNSPDGTSIIVDELSKEYNNIKLLRRIEKTGLASAVVDGFKIARGDILGVMDADFSHPPEKIVQFIDTIRNGYDLVIGSRYIKGGDYSNWTFDRKIISLGGKIVASLVTDVFDPMSGFFFFKRHVIENVALNPIGYKICLEILVKGKYSNHVEIPYIFNERKREQSKFSKKIILEYVYQMIYLLAYKIKRKIIG